MRPIKTLAILVLPALVLVAGAAARSHVGAQGASKAAAGGARANIWVDADGGSCVRHAKPVGYSSGEACGSFDAASDRCSSGDTVLIKAGAYGHQVYSGSNGRNNYCEMSAAPGEKVSARGLDVRGTVWVSLRAVSVVGGSASNPETIGLGGGGTSAGHIRLIGVSAYPGRIYIKGSGVTVVGGEFGGYDACRTGSEDDGIQVGYSSSASSYVTLDGIYLHDVRRTCGSTHTDCIQFLGIEHGVVENSRIENCPTEGIIARPQGGANVVNGLLIQNNFIGPVKDGSEGYDIGTSPDKCTNVVIQNNTFATGGSIDCVVTTGNVFRGNLVSGSAGCHDASYSDNRWTRGRACGSRGGICSAAFVNARAGNFHLSAGDRCARFRGSSSAGTTDIDGDLRPIRYPSDLGADQYETARIIPGRSIGRIALGQSRSSVEGFYGKPRQVRTTRLFPGGRKARVATYRRYSGAIRIAYSKNRVAGVSTTSAYYTTVSGAGVGASGVKGRWLACRSVIVSAGRGVVTYFAARAPTGAVSNVVIARRPFAGGARC